MVGSGWVDGTPGIELAEMLQRAARKGGGGAVERRSRRNAARTRPIPEQPLDRAHRDSGPTFARVARRESAGARRICGPRAPALTEMSAKSPPVSSTYA